MTAYVIAGTQAQLRKQNFVMLIKMTDLNASSHDQDDDDSQFSISNNKSISLSPSPQTYLSLSISCLSHSLSPYFLSYSILFFWFHHVLYLLSRNYASPTFIIGDEEDELDDDEPELEFIRIQHQTPVNRLRVCYN